MFNVGGPEVLVILLVALVVLGPKELPKAIRTVSNLMAELRKVSSGFQAEVQKVIEPIQTTAREATRVDQEPAAPPASAASAPDPGDDRATPFAAPDATAPAGDAGAEPVRD